MNAWQRALSQEDEAARDLVLRLMLEQWGHPYVIGPLAQLARTPEERAACERVEQLLRCAAGR